MSPDSNTSPTAAAHAKDGKDGKMGLEEKKKNRNIFSSALLRAAEKIGVVEQTVSFLRELVLN